VEQKANSTSLEMIVLDLNNMDHRRKTCVSDFVAQKPQGQDVQAGNLSGPKLSNTKHGR